MSPNKLGRRVNDNIRPMLDRLDQIGRAKGIVDHQRQAVPVSDRRDRIDIRNVTIRVSQSLQINRLCIRLNGRFHRRKIMRIHKRGRYSILR